ncbi:hypothetical protein [Kribbella sp. CA-247076]
MIKKLLTVVGVAVLLLTAAPMTGTASAVGAGPGCHGMTCW